MDYDLNEELKQARKRFKKTFPIHESHSAFDDYMKKERSTSIGVVSTSSGFRVRRAFLTSSGQLKKLQLGPFPSLKQAAFEHDMAMLESPGLSAQLARDLGLNYDLAVYGDDPALHKAATARIEKLFIKGSSAFREFFKQREAVQRAIALEGWDDEWEAGLGRGNEAGGAGAPMNSPAMRAKVRARTGSPSPLPAQAPPRILSSLPPIPAPRAPSMTALTPRKGSSAGAARKVGAKQPPPDEEFEEEDEESTGLIIVGSRGQQHYVEPAAKRPRRVDGGEGFHCSPGEDSEGLVFRPVLIQQERPPNPQAQAARLDFAAPPTIAIAIAPLLGPLLNPKSASPAEPSLALGLGPGLEEGMPRSASVFQGSNPASAVNSAAGDEPSHPGQPSASSPRGAGDPPASPGPSPRGASGSNGESFSDSEGGEDDLGRDEDRAATAETAATGLGLPTTPQAQLGRLPGPLPVGCSLERCFEWMRELDAWILTEGRARTVGAEDDYLRVLQRFKCSLRLASTSSAEQTVVLRKKLDGFAFDLAPYLALAQSGGLGPDSALETSLAIKSYINSLDG